MTPTMTITFDPTNAEDIGDLAVISDLLSLAHVHDKHGERRPEGAPVSVDDAAEQALGDLWPRLGSRLRLLVTAAAELSRDDGDYSLSELAEALGESPNVVRSWRANLGRSLKATAKNIPSAPPFFHERLDDGTDTWRFRMDPAIRDAVLGRTATTTD